MDDEPAMLAALRAVVGVRGDIATLDLGARFAGVLLMSHFVDTADEQFAAATLATAARHVHDNGFVVVERHPPGWVATVVSSDTESDGVRYVFTVLNRDGGVLTATIRYEFAGLRAEQRFSVRDTDDVRLASLAVAAGLRVDAVLNTAATLVLLRPRAGVGRSRPDERWAPDGRPRLRRRSRVAADCSVSHLWV